MGLEIKDIEQGVVDLFKGNFVSKEERETRFDICKGCDKLLKFYVCDECKCEMAVKTWLINSQCPLNKWNT